MDDLGRFYPVIAIVVFVAAMIGYWILSKKAVLGAAAMICVAGGLLVDQKKGNADFR